MNTDSRDKYTKGNVLPPLRFGFGNVGIDSENDGSAQGKERLFVGAHGEYTLRVTDKRRFLRAFGAEADEKRVRDATVSAVVAVGRSALEKLASDGVPASSHGEELERRIKSALADDPTLKKCGVAVESVTVGGFYVRDGKEELPSIVVENEAKKRPTALIASVAAVFAVALIAVIFIFTAPKTPSPSVTPTDGKYFTYATESDGVIITGYRGKDKDVVIPYEIRGMKVKEIAAGAFSGNSVMQNVTILPGAKKIGDGAFSSCENLEYVSVPGSVLTMGDNMFADCPSLVEVSVGDMTETNGAYSFKNCVSLKKIKIGESVDHIEKGQFSSCVSLKTVEIPIIFLGIREGAFAGCTALDHIALTYMTETIESGAFEGCTSLKYIIIPPSVTNIADDAFEGCTMLTIYCSEGSYAEQYAKENGLKYRFTGETLTDDLNGIRYEVNPDGTLTMSEYFGNAKNKLVVPPSFDGHEVKAIGDYAFSRKSVWITELEISEGIERIEESAFIDARIKYLTIPASVTEIEMGQNPFRYNYFVHFSVSPESKTLKTDEGGKFLLSADGKELYAYACGLSDDVAVIPDGVEILLNNAFAHSLIKYVEIPDSVYYIDWSVFLECSRLESVHISKNVIQIEGSAFLVTPNISELTVDKDNTVYRSENNVIYDRDGNVFAVASIATERVYTVPQCTVLCHDAMCGSKRIVHVVVPDGVIEIGSRAFIDCTNLRTIYIPESVTELGWSVFEYDWKHEYPKTVYGVSGSAAESYVAENGYAFADTKIVGDEIHIVKVTLNGQKSVNIPEMIDGRKVVIDDGAFDEISGIAVYGDFDGTAQAFARSMGYTFRKEATGAS